MELRTLNAFVTVAEKRSFVQAASTLHLSQPAITAQIQRLEQELGVLLFDRSRRTVALTRAGEAFLDGAKNTLATAQEAALAAKRAANEQTVRLRFGFPPSASREIVPNITTRFHRTCPHVKLDLFSLHTSVTVEELQLSALDIGFVRLPVEAKGLRIIPAHHEPLVICLPESHPLAAQEKIRFSDLQEERFILYGRKWAPGFHDRIIERCIKAGFQPMVSNTIDEMYLGPALVAAGEGIAILPSMVVNSAVEGVAVRELLEDDICSEIGIATRTEDDSPIIRAAVAIAREVCNQYSF
ncbi:LysR family transcriptional regulator [Granulicella cerasi]|uniref:LysR family transcriptional regulator n=1 Tax=Granulicella cerasi TaxID=741063 RepID=A0ABW1ZAQ6_9BACT|nr:LysR family transcriptional regulator [Granulicella cerasi]